MTPSLSLSNHRHPRHPSLIHALPALIHALPAGTPSTQFLGRTPWDGLRRLRRYGRDAFRVDGCVGGCEMIPGHAGLDVTTPRRGYQYATVDWQRRPRGSHDVEEDVSIHDRRLGGGDQELVNDWAGVVFTLELQHFFSSPLTLPFLYSPLAPLDPGRLDGEQEHDTTQRRRYNNATVEWGNDQEAVERMGRRRVRDRIAGKLKLLKKLSSQRAIRYNNLRTTLAPKRIDLQTTVFASQIPYQRHHALAHRSIQEHPQRSNAVLRSILFLPSFLQHPSFPTSPTYARATGVHRRFNSVEARSRGGILFVERRSVDAHTSLSFNIPACPHPTSFTTSPTHARATGVYHRFNGVEARSRGGTEEGRFSSFRREEVSRCTHLGVIGLSFNIPACPPSTSFTTTSTHAVQQRRGAILCGPLLVEGKRDGSQRREGIVMESGGLVVDTAYGREGWSGKMDVVWGRTYDCSTLDILCLATPAHASELHTADRSLNGHVLGGGDELVGAQREGMGERLNWEGQRRSRSRHCKRDDVRIRSHRRGCINLPRATYPSTSTYLWTHPSADDEQRRRQVEKNGGDNDEEQRQERQEEGKERPRGKGMMIISTEIQPVERHAWNHRNSFPKSFHDSLFVKLAALAKRRGMTLCFNNQCSTTRQLHTNLLVYFQHLPPSALTSPEPLEDLGHSLRFRTALDRPFEGTWRVQIGVFRRMEDSGVGSSWGRGDIPSLHGPLKLVISREWQEMGQVSGETRAVETQESGEEGMEDGLRSWGSKSSASQWCLDLRNDRVANRVQKGGTQEQKRKKAVETGEDRELGWEDRG
ncbi:hypothetical protein B0H34DRAFT_676549 [Crassisporium funariophilum]|nr:hypothetical protein B0H34DRAFT_676549 [Crassisporium funariophilum]